MFVAREAGRCAQAAIEDVYCGARSHHQLLIVARNHRHRQGPEGQEGPGEQLLWKVERHSRQAAAALAGSLPALRPQRAHGGRRTILQLQRRQHERHQVTREQHSLDRPLSQRLVRGEDGFGLGRDFGRSLASSDGDLQELRVRELEEMCSQLRGSRCRRAHVAASSQVWGDNACTSISRANVWKPADLVI
eukprot:scaffold41746_cov67-Phaeocystis_antarctica.AAC.6